MSSDRPFSGISVLIPGYSVDDIPTDLNEPKATGLLNAIACAWHPHVILAARGVPQFRYADVTELLDTSQILLVPESSEEWMGHDWRVQLEAGNCQLIDGAVERSEWLEKIDQLFGADHNPIDTELINRFLALGLSWYLVMALSRRMHYYIDPDEARLSSAIHDAATAAQEGRREEAERALSDGFECMLETREQLFPVETWLLDVCLPASPGSEAELLDVIRDTSNVNLMISPAELDELRQHHSDLFECLEDATNSGRCCLVSGGWHELRCSLGSLSAAYSDLQRGQSSVAGRPGIWGQRRFGLLHCLPTLLNLFDYRFALHFALDDGLYPEREVGYFDWTAPGGSRIATSSRLPIAIDSAASFLRLPERLAEAMQQDTAAVVLLARLPSLATSWLQDLRRMHECTPLIGRFVTFAELCDQSEPTSESVTFRAGEYLAPHLIQASVLKTEAPVTGPAALHQCRSHLECLAFVHALTRILSPAQTNDAPIDDLDLRLQDAEHQQLETAEPCDTDAQQQAIEQIESQIRHETSRQTQQLAGLLPDGSARGMLIVNPLPFAREATIQWPASLQPPQASDSVSSAWQQDNTTFVRVKTPPGGFVQLAESSASTTTLALNEPGGRPLAEDGLLRNELFEVILSSSTGGIADVRFHGQRANRVSQQVAFRYESPKTVPATESTDEYSTPWAATRCDSLRILSAGPWTAAMESRCTIHDVIEGTDLFRFRQVTTVERTVPRITVDITVDPEFGHSVTGNPWMTYLACRFAWDNEAAAISRTQLGQLCGFQGERFEAPDFIEIADEDHRLLILSHGRPYHRRSGHRMLDSLLVVEGQPLPADGFRFTIAFDEPHPQRVAADLSQPLITEEVSSAASTSAWILGCTAKNVQIARIRCTDRSVTILMQETEGRATSCQLRCARPPLSAQHQKATGTVLQELQTDDAGVSMNFSSFEVKEVQLTF